MSGEKWESWLKKATEMGLDDLTSKLTKDKFDADQEVFRELADHKLLKDKANEDRRKEAYNSKEGKQARNEYNQLADRSTHLGADTMEKYGQMLKKGIADLLNGHSKYNQILNMLYDAPGYIQSKFPRQGAPIKCPKPSEALIIDANGQIKFNPVCKATDKEKQLALDLFRVHMVKNEYTEVRIQDPTTHIESYRFLDSNNNHINESKLNHELKSSDDSIKGTLGTNIDWLEPEDNTLSPG